MRHFPASNGYFKYFLLAFLIILIIPTSSFPASETGDINIIVQDENGPARILSLYNKMTAVIIGIDAYADLKEEQKQNSSVRDAKNLEEVLRKKYQVSTFVALYNEQATGDNIMKALEDLSSAGPDDAVLVYFSGHGINRPTAWGDMGYFIPYDGSLKHDEIYKNISMQQIKENISTIVPAKHVLFIMDIGPGGFFPGIRQAMQESRKPAYPGEIMREPARQVITSMGTNERQPHIGTFTGRLIELLNNKSSFFYASGLGSELQQKAGKEKQHPFAGYIYGSGDFVFVPDPVKLREEADGVIADIEADILKLDAMKDVPSKKKKTAGTKDLERKRALKDSELKQAKALRESAVKEIELKETIWNAGEDPAEKERIGKERTERLGYLTQQSEKMKRELSDSPAALSLSDAQAEIKRTNELLEKLSAGKETAVDIQGKASIERYKKTLTAQKYRIMKQVFPISDKGIQWRFIECNPGKEEFYLSAVVREETLFSKAIIPKTKLAEYCRKPDLLTVMAVVSLSENALPQTPGLILKAAGKPDLEEVYRADNLEKSRFIHFNLTVLDTETNLIWAAGDNTAGRKMTWYDASKYLKQLNDQKYAGYSDWRLPTKEEFEKLADYAKNKGIKKDMYKTFNETGFKNIKSDMYWSSTASSINANLAWFIYMWNGYMDRGNKANLNYVWPVRNGE